MRKGDKEVLLKLLEGERLYKWTGKLPPTIMFDKSEERISNRGILSSLFKKALIKIDDHSACETWYILTDIGQQIASNLKSKQ